MNGYAMLTNPYLIALGIPLILIVSGAFAKKLVRSSTWQLSDFYLGVELSLASTASALVYIFDLAKVANASKTGVPPVDNKFTATAAFLALSFFLLLWILSTHQDWERRPQNSKGQFFLVGHYSELDWCRPTRDICTLGEGRLTCVTREPRNSQQLSA